MDRALEDFAVTGYVIDRALLHPQVNAVAVPLRSDDGKMLFSPSWGGINQLFDDILLRDIATEHKQLSALLPPVLGATTG